MHIEVIRTWEAFAKLKDDWEAIYAADPDAQFFLSWTWLSVWMKDMQKWGILAARPDASSPPVAFFPLRLRVAKTSAGELRKEVAMAGNRGADYTGFICRPECDDDVIPAFAAYLKKMSWHNLHLENLYLSSKRISRFLSFFPKDKFDIRIIKIVNRADETDQHKCPYVDLPESWDTYLNESLGTSTRQKARRFLRKVDDSHDLRISHATASTIDDDLNILFRLWMQKWGEKKRELRQSTYRDMLRRTFEAGALFLPVCWSGQKPIGALATFIDPEKKSLLFFVAGRDETWKGPPPGFTLHAYSLRFAIDNGFRRYDFLRGNEPYKYLFGCKERQIWYFVISVKVNDARGVDAQERHLQGSCSHQAA